MIADVYEAQAAFVLLAGVENHAVVDDQIPVSVSFSVQVACSPLSWLLHSNVAEPLTFL